jgi:hypothetical protein
VDGSTHIGVELIGNAIADGKFLFDAAEGFGGSDEDPQTGFIDGTIDGGVGLSLDISPDGAFIGLPASISASLDLIAESPNWIISPPLLSDPLGFEEVLNAGTAQGPGANNGAETELGFDIGLSETKKAKADTFFLEDVYFSGEFGVFANDISATASIGFLGVTATLNPTLDVSTGKFIGADVDFGLRNPVDGSTHIGVELIGNAIADGKFLFDAAEGFGGSDEDPQTGFIDGTIDGGVGLSLDISPDGAFIGLPASISASLDLIAESRRCLLQWRVRRICQ